MIIYFPVGNFRDQVISDIEEKMAILLKWSVDKDRDSTNKSVAEWLDRIDHMMEKMHGIIHDRKPYESLWVLSAKRRLGEEYSKDHPVRSRWIKRKLHTDQFHNLKKWCTRDLVNYRTWIQEKSENFRGRMLVHDLGLD